VFSDIYRYYFLDSLLIVLFDIVPIFRRFAKPCLNVTFDFWSCIVIVSHIKRITKSIFGEFGYNIFLNLQRKSDGV